jgi:hypothetical protein
MIPDVKKSGVVTSRKMSNYFPFGTVKGLEREQSHSNNNDEPWG